MPPIIEVSQIAKTYRVFRKKEGVKGAIEGLFKREYKQVDAVNEISFSIEKCRFASSLNCMPNRWFSDEGNTINPSNFVFKSSQLPGLKR